MSRTEKILRRWPWWVALVLAVTLLVMGVLAYQQWRAIQWVEGLSGTVISESGWLRESTPDRLSEILDRNLGDRWSLAFDRVVWVEFKWFEGKQFPELSKLGNLRGLERLGLINVLDRHLVDLRDLKGLETLEISSGRITEEGLLLLNEIPMLKSLTINSNLTNSYLQSLGQIQKVGRLSVSSGSVTDEGLKYLAGVSNLVALSLDYNERVSATGLKLLKACPNLEELSLNGTSVSDEELIMLRSELPDCVIHKAH